MYKKVPAYKSAAHLIKIAAALLQESIIHARARIKRNVGNGAAAISAFLIVCFISIIPENFEK